MTYHQLTSRLAKRFHLTKKRAREVADVLFHLVGEASARGERTLIPGFGVFSRRHRKARRIRNPVTSKPMRLPSSKTVGFRAAGILKEAANR